MLYPPHTDLAAKIGMPTVMNLQLLTDMGRMNGQWRIDEELRRSRAGECSDLSESVTYRSVLLGFRRASIKEGEISLSRSARRLASAIGWRPSVLSTALRRHSFISRT